MHIWQKVKAGKYINEIGDDYVIVIAREKRPASDRVYTIEWDVDLIETGLYEEGQDSGIYDRHTTRTLAEAKAWAEATYLTPLPDHN